MNPFDRLHVVAEHGGLTGRTLARLCVGRSPITPLAEVGRPVPGIAPGRRATVSVIIPCYNYAHFLPGCIGSALEQPGVDVEVIVVDDASTDGSGEVVRDLASRDLRIRLVSRTCNQGPVATFNAGLADVTGEFTVRLDADDLLAPGALCRAVALFDHFPSVGLVYGHPLHFSTLKPAATITRLRGWTIWPGRAWLERRCELGVNCITSPEVVMRQDVVLRVGGQRELAQTHDMEMWMRIAAVSDVGHIDGPDQAMHREHPSSRSARMVDPLTDLLERRAAFDVLFEGVGGQVPGADELHDKARRALAGEALDHACRAFERGTSATEPIEKYIDFAIDVFPEARTLRVWRALARRRSVSVRYAPLLPHFFASAVVRRLVEEWAYLRWSRTGV